MSDLFDPEDEPDGDVAAPHHLWVGLALAAFSFGSVWRYYPTIGSVMTIAGILIALDDAVEHALEVKTPLDQLWKRVIYPLVKRIEERGRS